MALGKQYKNDGSKVYVLKPQSKDDKGNRVPPHFAVYEKVDGKWVKTREETRVSGDLFKVEIKEFEFDKVKTKSVTVGLRDEQSKEAYLLDLRFTKATRNLYNMLASLTDNFSNLSVSLYSKEYQGKEYDTYSLRQGDSLVPWKYKQADLPKPIEVTFKGQVQRDYTPIDEIFEKELQELATRLSRRAPAPAVSTPSTASTPTEPLPPF